MRYLFLSLLLLAAPLVAQVPYSVEFRGTEDATLLCLIKESSNLVLDQKCPPSSLTGLIERAQSDLVPLTQLLHSQGYYSADIRFRLDRRSDPVRVIVTLQIGPRFPIARLAILPSIEDPGVYPFEQLNPGIGVGDPAVAESILKAEASLLCQLECQGYPLAKIVDRQVIVDLSRLDVELLFYINSGPLCRFGPLCTNGVRKVSSRAIGKAIAWREGEVYSPRLVAESCRRLRDMALFNHVSLVHREQLDSCGLLPMELTVIERKQRTIAVGGSYNTRELWGVNASWYNRNLRRMGDKLTLDGEYNQRKKLLGALYRDIQFRHPDQDLLLIGLLKEDDVNPGYDEKLAKIGVAIERWVSCRFRYSYGAQLQQMGVTNSFNNGDFTVASLPLSASWDASNNLLDPTRGYTAYIDIEPASDASHSFASFVKACFTGTLYYPLLANCKLVLAGWGSIGTIVGTSNHHLPPPYRFYAGDDSTLRGYKYQSVGPINSFGKPIGGRSLLLYGIELRARINCKFGAVTFFEMGNVFLSEFPKFNHKLLKSWGVGLRYFTAIGPLSLDIAFPLDRRPGIDKPFQVYLIVGQAF